MGSVYIYTIGVISHHQRGVFRHSDLTQCVYICVHCSCDVSRLREYGVMKMKVQSVIVLKYSFSYQRTYVYTYLHTYLYTLICVLLWLITQANRYQNRHNKSSFGKPRQTTIIYVKQVSTNGVPNVIISESANATVWWIKQARFRIWLPGVGEGGKAEGYLI